MLVACRLAGLSALEGHYAGVNGRTQQAHTAMANQPGAELRRFAGGAGRKTRRVPVFRLRPDV